jgi:hypothetical protein
MPVPDFSPGEVLTAAAMDSIGLWLVKTQTVGTGVSSVVITNAFSADYANYRITWTGGTLSATTNVRMVLGAAATGYYSQTIYAAYSVSGGALANIPDNNAVRWNYVGTGNTNFASVRMDLYNPQATTRTLMSTQYADGASGGVGNGFLDNATSYTDFTLSPGSGTMTGGTIRVYGYRN